MARKFKEHVRNRLVEPWNVWRPVGEHGVHAQVVDWHDDGQWPAALGYQPTHAPLVPDPGLGKGILSSYR